MKHRLLKPLPSVGGRSIPAGTIYTYYSSDVLTQYEARDLPYEATQALHCLSPRTVENNPDFFQKVEDTPPYPMQQGEEGFWLHTCHFAPSVGIGGSENDDINAFRTKEHAEQASAAIKQLIALLHQRWNDEAAGKNGAFYLGGLYVFPSNEQHVLASILLTKLSS